MRWSEPMPLLPAVVPLTAEKRSELVPARLARNLAPLFGVASPVSPFGTMTWLMDFNRITISEIARGAPSPRRSEAADLPPPPAGQDWVVHGRAVAAAPGKALPNEIVNATTNRFGPHTKSAVVLTATNTLLEPVARGIEGAMPLLRAGDGGELPLTLRVVAWATAAIEVFRSQPALVVAAAKARRIQRESLDGPRFGQAVGLGDRTFARDELDAEEPRPLDPVTHPRDLMVLDRTVACVRLPDLADPTGRSGVFDLDSDAGARSTARDLHDELVDRLITMLLDACEPEGVGYVWKSERVPEQFVAEALLPASRIVDDLLDFWRSVHGNTIEAYTPTALRLPDPDTAAALSPAARRVLVLAAVGLARYLRSDIGAPGLSEADFLRVLDDIDRFAERCLDAADPVVAVAHTRIEVLRVMVLRHNRTNPVAAAVRALVDAVDHCLDLLADGVLDRGATADVLGAACIELNAIRSTRAGYVEPDLLTASELDGLLRRYWAAYADALQIDLSTPDEVVRHGIGYHLHNYAAFLGSHEDTDDLREAVRLFRDVVIPSRRRLHRRIGVFGPLGRTYYVATAATSKLGERARAENRPEEARRWAALGYEWIDRVLREREAAGPAAESDQQAGLFALRAAPALLLALETGVVPVTAKELDRLHRLSDLAQRWVVTGSGGNATDHVRHHEAEEIGKRIAELTAS